MSAIDRVFSATFGIQEQAFNGLAGDEARTVRQLLQAWADHRDSNARRTVYHRGEQAFKDLGISLPPQMRDAKSPLGWAAMAVDKPASRIQFDGLRLPGEDDPLGLSRIFVANNVQTEFRQAVVSAGIHGFSLATVARGASTDDSEVQIQFHDAEACAAIWDRRNRRLGAALTLTELDEDGNPLEAIVYLPGSIITIRRDAKSWEVKGDRYPSIPGRAQAVPVRNWPTMTRPLGRSRITRPVMELTDMGVRTLVRMEGTAEFYSAPQIAILGVAEGAFGNADAARKFQILIDRIMGLERDEDGNVPSIEQLQQASMVPHESHLRTIAAAFSGETGIPVNSLGILHEQPASAEAMRAAERDLLIDVQAQIRDVLAPAMCDLARMVVMVRDGLSAPPEESWALSAKFADAEFRSASSEADAVLKIAQSMDLLVKYPVLAERLFDPEQIKRLMADQRRTAGQDAVAALLGAALPVPAAQSDEAAPDAFPRPD